MTNTTYPVELNFLPLRESRFRFLIYRKPRPPDEPHVPGTRYLPVEEIGDGPPPANAAPLVRRAYEVSYAPADGFEPYQCFTRLNTNLTLNALYRALERRVTQPDLADHVILPSKPIDRRISFILERHQEGNSVVWLRPYDLKRTGQFGFLTRFEFNVAPGTHGQFRRIQQLSLSTKGGKPNRDFYTEHYERVIRFLKRFGAQIEALELDDGTRVQLEFKLRELDCHSLNERVYVLGNNAEVKTPFQGLRQSPPLKLAPQDRQLVFLFREDDRRRSQELFRALRGDLFTTFPGMEQLFGCPIGKENTSGVAIPDFSYATLSAVAEELVGRYPDTAVVPVAIVPFARQRSEEDTEGYFRAKHAFLRVGMPSQFVFRDRFDDRESMKWSISNLGLAIFAKMGGQPWKVKPTTPKCLIVGIGQAHQEVEGQPTKYFAYSVLTDSSGLYEKIHVLGSSSDETQYLAGFRDNLRSVLETHRDTFDSFVIHASFSLRHAEMDAIKELLSEIQEGGDRKEFAALKFNDRNDYFGYSSVANSRVPYESSFLQLSRSEYLLWFDGLNRQNPTVTRRPELPMHVQILFPREIIPEDTAARYLQDAINIAGANWRGFNARSIPISVYYARIIAHYYGRFQQLGLPDIDLEGISPWFL